MRRWFRRVGRVDSSITLGIAQVVISSCRIYDLLSIRCSGIKVVMNS